MRRIVTLLTLMLLLVGCSVQHSSDAAKLDTPNSLVALASVPWDSLCHLGSTDGCEVVVIDSVVRSTSEIAYTDANASIANIPRIIEQSRVIPGIVMRRVSYAQMGFHNDSAAAMLAIATPRLTNLVYDPNSISEYYAHTQAERVHFIAWVFAPNVPYAHVIHILLVHSQSGWRVLRADVVAA